jgi:hypothetical protein
MRALWLIVACACGGKTSSVAPSNVGTPSVPVSQPAVTGDCEPRASGWDPGHHDRYSFEDTSTGKYGYKTKAGAIAIAASYASVYEFSPGGVAGVASDQGLQFIDPKGNTIARAFAFDNGPDYFQEGFARIVDAQKHMGYLDEAGRIAIAPKYDFAAPFCHGKAQVEIGKDRFFIDRQGNKTTPPPEGLQDYEPHRD